MFPSVEQTENAGKQCIVLETRGSRYVLSLRRRGPLLEYSLKTTLTAIYGTGMVPSLSLGWAKLSAHQ